MNLLEKMLKLVNPKALAAPAGDSQSTTLRSDFSETIVAGLTPQKLAGILREAVNGDVVPFLTLAEEMEELDPHYRSVLSTRKLAVASIEPEVVPGVDDKLGNEIATFVKSIVSAPQFADLITDLLDGLGKGYSICEIEWDTSGNQWKPDAYIWRDPRGFVYDRKTRSILERTVDGKGAALEPFRFVTHTPKLKSGLPVRGALARLAAWSFLFKNYTLKDWVRFIEVYGMPIRVGKYHAGATEDDKRNLLRAVANIGSDAAAIMPASMAVEFVQSASGTAAQGPVFGQFADYLDSQVSKGVLGQTMTTDNGSSKAQAQVHNEVRLDIKAADARQLTMTLQRDVIIPAVVLNYGMQKVWPSLRLPVEEPEDMKVWTDNLATMMDRGLKASLTQVREKLALDEPMSDDDILEAVKAAEPTLPANKTKLPKAKAKASHLPSCPCCNGKALASQHEQDAIDRLLEEALAKAGGDLGVDLDGVLEPVLALAAQASSFDDFILRLSSIAGEQDTVAIMNRLGPLMFMARGVGDAVDDPNV
jgi:phage gp29-like protein